MLPVIFVVISLLCCILFYFGTGKDKRLLWGSLLWMIATGLVSYTGYFENTAAKPPRLIFVMLPAIVLSVVAFNKVRRNKLNLTFLVAVHALRLPVELALFQLFLQKQIPILMTFKGWNFDIVIGITAIGILAVLLRAKTTLNRSFLVLWNLAGLAFLITIVTIAILSSPLPIQQFAFNQPNIAVFQFPYIYLPACIVPMVFLSHLLVLSNKDVK
jgi:hypothetical protein